MAAQGGKVKNQAITAGFQDAFKLSWKLAMAEVDVLDYRKGQHGQPRLFVASDPRGALGLAFGPPDIESKEKCLVGIRIDGCELVWKL